jgi:hypothetical protein
MLRRRIIGKKDKDYGKEYFTMVSLEDNNQITFGNSSKYNGIYDLYWSIDNGGTWNPQSSLPATINSGQKIRFKRTAITTDGGYTIFSQYIQIDGSYRYSYFTTTKKVNVEGNIMSLIYGDDFAGRTVLDFTDFNKSVLSFGQVLFYSLFRHSQYEYARIVDAGNLILPLTSFKASFSDGEVECRYAYYHMFCDCTTLKVAPELPATTLTSYCYCGMFDNCTSLTTAPSILPAMNLTSSCYVYMFYGCTALEVAPELPARTLLFNMSWNFTSYGHMFINCSKLRYIKAMFTTTPGTYYTPDWVSGVSSTGVFVKNSAATWTNTYGANAIPEGWTVQTATS